MRFIVCLWLVNMFVLPVLGASNGMPMDKESTQPLSSAVTISKGDLIIRIIAEQRAAAMKGFSAEVGWGKLINKIYEERLKAVNSAYPPK